MNQQNLPNATAVLVLGIFSVVGCCCYGVPGLIAGLIGLMLYKKDKALYIQNPSQYSNYSNLNTGRILCIVGLVLSAIYIIGMIILLITGGWEAYMQRMEELKSYGR